MKKLSYFLMPILALSLQSCEPDEDNPTIVNDNSYHVQFVLNGDTVRYEDGVNGYGNGPGKTANEDSLGWNFSEFTIFIRHPDTPNFEKNAFTIALVKRFVISPTYEERYEMFNPGGKSFGSWPLDTTQTLVNGAILTYTDNSGKVWSSDLLFGNQPSSSSFVITEHLTVDAPLFGSKTRGTFNATLYDGVGASITISDGKFLARTLNKQ